MSLDLTNESTLQRIIEIVESQENDERIRKHTKDYQLVFSNLKKLVQDELSRRYPESWDTMTVIYLKIANKILRKLSRCYAAGVTRVVKDKKGNEDKELTSLINYIYNDVGEGEPDFNSIMEKTNFLYSNHRYVELFAYLNDDNRIRYKPLPQHLFTAIPDKHKRKAEALVFKQDVILWDDMRAIIDWDNYDFNLDDVEVSNVYTIWTEKSNINIAKVNVRIKEDEKEITVSRIVQAGPNEGNKNGTNPYGAIPSTGIKESTEGHYYPFGTEIAEMAREINVVLSDLVSIAAQQGFGQAVIYFDSEKPPAITKTGPTHVINIPNKNGNSKFEFANAHPDLAGHLNIALSLVRMLLTTNDLTTDKVSGELSATNFASGIDRLIADSETIENVNDQRKKYVIAEKNNFKKTILILKYLAESKLWPDDYPKISVNKLNSALYDIELAFGAIQPLSTEKGKAEDISFLDEKGFILPWEKHMRFNPGLTETQAKAREEEIKESKKESQKDFIKKEADKFTQGVDNASGNREEHKSNGYSKEGQEEDRESGNTERFGQKKDRERYSKADQRENTVRDRGRGQR